MHTRRNTALGVAFAMAMLLPGPAWAAPTQVNMRIEGRGETLFEGPIATEGHDVQASSDTHERSCDGINPLDPENTTPGPTPTAAADDAMRVIGETFDGDWYPGYNDYFITRWGADEENLATGAYWGVLVNDVFTSVGGCQYELHAGDEVLWLYNAFKIRANLALLPAGDTAARPPLTAIAELNKPFQVEVIDYADSKEDNPPVEPDREAATPYPGAKVSPVLTSANGVEKVQTESPETVTTDSEGRASIAFTTPGWHRIKAGTPLDAEGEEQAVRSNRIDVCVPAHGQSSCGAAPPEDDLRIPPAYVGASQEEHHEESTEPKSTEPVGAAGASSGGSFGSGSGATTPAVSAAGSSTPAPAPGAGALPAQLVLESVNSKRLLLTLAAAGTVTVRIAWRMRSGRGRRWRELKTIAAKAGKGGPLYVKLPRLAAGTYRVSVTLAGAHTVTKILTVSHR